jgi:hypothetical protein
MTPTNFPLFLLLHTSALFLLWMDATVINQPGDWSGNASAAAPALALLRRPRGRPRKYAEPSRTLTLTLPESVLSLLSAIHEDVSQAIVRLTRGRKASGTRKAADLLVFGERAVITIRPTPSLELRAGVQLVPLPDGRALIALESPESLAALQLSINDALDDGNMSRRDRAVYENLRDILREARLSNEVTLQHRHIIVLEARRPSRGNGKSTTNRKVSRISV